jgi:hypothetical protein
LFAAHGGAFPVRIKDVVGTVTVSSLPQTDDHAFVTEMIGAFLGALAAHGSLRFRFGPGAREEHGVAGITVRAGGSVLAGAADA